MQIFIFSYKKLNYRTSIRRQFKSRKVFDLEFLKLMILKMNVFISFLLF